MSTTIDEATQTAARWVDVARELADDFKTTATQREHDSQLPTEELQRVRDSGLVNLLIPTEYGGEGGDWKVAARVITELAKADPNIGVLLAYHYHNFLPPQLDYGDGGSEIQRRSAEHRWLWGHLTQPWGADLTATPRPDGGFVLNGGKPLNTGAATGDVVVVLAERTDRREFVYVLVPTDREGITFGGGWDHLGLRRTNTVPVRLENVQVAPDEVLTRTDPEPLVRFPALYPPTGALAFGSVYLGAALGSLESARDYVRQKAGRPGLPAPREDPFTLAELGRLSIKVQALTANRDSVAAAVTGAVDQRATLERQDIERVNRRAEAFRLLGGRIGLAVTSGVYDVIGASATAASYGFDRFWRDIRIHTLHVPTAPFGDREVGDYVVNGRTEYPSFYLGREDAEPRS